MQRCIGSFVISGSNNRAGEISWPHDISAIRVRFFLSLSLYKYIYIYIFDAAQTFHVSSSQGWLQWKWLFEHLHAVTIEILRNKQHAFWADGAYLHQGKGCSQCFKMPQGVKLALFNSHENMFRKFWWWLRVSLAARDTFLLMVGCHLRRNWNI